MEQLSLAILMITKLTEKREVLKAWGDRAVKSIAVQYCNIKICHIRK